jgi:branched-chain amino acid transport system permease protein
MSQYLLNIFILLLLYALLGLSFGVVMGQGGLFTIATAGVYGVGAYGAAVALRDWGFDLSLAIVVGISIACLAGMLVAVAALYVSDDYFIVATLAIQVGLVELFNALPITGGPGGFIGIPPSNFFGIPVSTQTRMAVIASLILVFVVAGYWCLQRSQLGQTLRALREDERVTLALGRNVRRAKILSFVFACAIAGAAGALLAAHMRYVNPASFDLTQSVLIAEFAIIGGISSLSGPIIGAALVVGLGQALTWLNVSTEDSGAVSQLLFGIVLLLFVRFRPQGMVSQRFGIGRVVGPHGDAVPADTLVRRAPGPLKCESVTVLFGGFTALRNVSVTFSPGQITGLLGPNGAGKTTLFNVLSGALQPWEGKVSLGSTHLTYLASDARARAGIGRSFQDIGIFAGLSVLENTLAGVRQEDGSLPHSREQRTEARQTAERLLAHVGLGDLANMRAGELGYAQKKLLMMARLVAGRSSVYLLDEPLSGLDRFAREKMLHLIRELRDAGAVVVLVEHSVEVVRQVCDQVVFLGSGEIQMIGTPSTVTSDARLVEAYFGTASRATA